MSTIAEVKQDVLDQKILDKIYLYSRDGKQPDRTNFFGWDTRVVGHSNAIFFFVIQDEELQNEIKNTLLEKGIFKRQPKIWNANIALYSRNSFIPWHNDANHKFSATIYLNKNWDKNWGGYLMYEQNGEIKCHIPTYNSCVCYDTPKEHSVMLTSIAAPMRESLQVFVDEWE
jgi:hypothetical protein